MNTQSVRLEDRNCRRTTAPAVESATFDRLVSPLRGKIRGYLAKRVAPDVADELVQDVFLAAYQNLDTLQDARYLESWLYTIAANRLTDYYRRRARAVPTTFLDLSDDSSPAVQQSDDRERPSGIEDRLWVEKMLEAAKAACSDIQFTVLGLYYRCESFEEIAAMLQLDAVTVRSHFLRGRAQLLAHLIAQEPDLVGGQEAIQAAIRRLREGEAAEEGLSREEVQALAQPQRWVKNFRSACLKIARHLPVLSPSHLSSRAA